MQSKIRAAQGAVASHAVSRRSPCPRRLYYIRYYTEAPSAPSSRPGRRCGAPRPPAGTSNTRSAHWPRHHLPAPKPMSLRSAAQIGGYLKPVCEKPYEIGILRRGHVATGQYVGDAKP
jgi:hypothetical protein